MFADQLRSAVEASPRVKLPELAAVLWRAYGQGQVTEAEAESLSGLIELKRLPAEKPAGAPRKAVGSRPRSDASMERRRRWAASGRLPPAIAAQFTLAEQAVLSVITMETVKRGDCRLTHDHIAALAGVSRSTVKATLRRARDLGLVAIEERRSTAWRNLPNIVRIAAREWQTWMRLVRRAPTGGGGVKSSPTTNTNLKWERERPSKLSLGLPRRREAEPLRAIG